MPLVVRSAVGVPGSDGCVRIALLTRPGSWPQSALAAHDSAIAQQDATPAAQRIVMEKLFGTQK